jgi:hypothetical protein
MSALFWTNVGVDVQTALATALTITGITKANPGVVTYTGTDPTNGDYVYLLCTGMIELNDRIFRVANVNAGSNTFELEGENTTDYGTFAAGTVQVITFGASFNILQSFNVTGGDPEYADTTTIHDSIRKRAPTVTSPMSISSDAIFDPADPGYIEANRAYKAKAKRAFKLRFGTTAKMAFVGFVSAPGVPRGQAQGVVQTSLAIEAQNFPSAWAT